MSINSEQMNPEAIKALMIKKALEEGVDFEAIHKGLETKTYYIGADQEVPLHDHFSHDELFYCVSGNGTGVVDGKRYSFSPGEAFLAPAGSMHTIESDDTQCVLAFLIPVNRIVCHCKNVSFIEIRKAMVAGARSVEDIKTMTGAGTGCGQCVDTIHKIVNMACECNNISVDEVVRVVLQGADSLEKISSMTGAGNGCGNCKRILQSIIDNKG